MGKQLNNKKLGLTEVVSLAIGTMIGASILNNCDQKLVVEIVWRYVYLYGI